MFKIVEDRRTWQPVIWHGFAEDGKRVRNKIEMQFRMLPSDDYAALIQNSTELAAGAREAEGEDEAKSLSEAAAEYLVARQNLILDWKGVAEANGDPIKFSQENLARLFNCAFGTLEATMLAYRQAMAGGKDARTGN